MQLTLQIESWEDYPAGQSRAWIGASQTLCVGRLPTMADFVVEDAQMSSRHFQISYENRRFILRDLNSTNGTLVNGKKATKAVLGDGDKITTGQTAFLVSISGCSERREEHEPVAGHFEPADSDGRSGSYSPALPPTSG